MDDGTSQAYVRGETLMTRKVSPCELPQMVDKFDFVIKSDNVINVGRITACDVEGNTITLHGLNVNYKDVVINISNIEWAYRFLFARVRIISYLCIKPSYRVFLIALKPFVRVRIGGFFIMCGDFVVTF